MSMLRARKIKVRYLSGKYDLPGLVLSLPSSYIQSERLSTCHLGCVCLCGKSSPLKSSLVSGQFTPAPYLGLFHNVCIAYPPTFWDFGLSKFFMVLGFGYPL